jgi:hypothetical protein
MKVQLGDGKRRPPATPPPAGWQRLSSPSSRRAYLVAGAIGLATPFLVVVWLTGISLILPAAPRPGTASPWVAMMAALLLFVPLHELAHALCQPGQGLSDRTVLVVWPRKLRVAVYYDGCQSRRRWLLMRLAPLLLFTGGPLLLLTLLRPVAIPFAIEVFLQVLMLVNGIGSGGDLVAAGWVWRAVPAGGAICFRNGRAYWHLTGQA